MATRSESIVYYRMLADFRIGAVTATFGTG